MRYTLILVAAAMVGAHAPGEQRPCSAPAEVRLVAGGMPQVVSIDNPAKTPIAVVNTTTTQLGFWQIVSPSPGKLSFLAFSQTPGTYEVCFMANGATAAEPPAEAARTKIIVSGTAPTPVDPVDPVDPEPTDEATKSLNAAVKAAYLAETAAGKDALKDRLAFMYRDSIKTTTKDPAVATYGDWFTRNQETRKAMIGENLAGVRAVLGKQLFEAKLPTDPAAPLDRKKAAAALLAAAKSLEAIR